MDVLEELKARLKAVIEGYKTVSAEKNANTSSTTQPTAEQKVAPVAANTNTSAIKNSVGKGGKNDKADVLIVQKLLNKVGYKLVEDGDYGNNTLKAIMDYQAKVMKFADPDGLISAGGKTWQQLSKGTAAPSTGGNETPNNNTEQPQTGGDFTHPKAGEVKLSYDGKSARQLNSRADKLLRSILASCGIFSAKITSSKRTYGDQARIVQAQSPVTSTKMYGQEVSDAAHKQGKSQEQFAQWLKDRDAKRGKYCSKHIPGFAIDVVPQSGDRAKYAAKGKELAKTSGSGVTRLLAVGELNEPVDHIEFAFEVTDIKGIQ